MAALYDLRDVPGGVPYVRSLLLERALLAFPQYRVPAQCDQDVHGITSSVDQGWLPPRTICSPPAAIRRIAPLLSHHRLSRGRDGQVGSASPPHPSWPG